MKLRNDEIRLGLSGGLTDSRPFILNQSGHKSVRRQEKEKRERQQAYDEVQCVMIMSGEKHLHRIR